MQRKHGAYCTAAASGRHDAVVLKYKFQEVPHKGQRGPKEQHPQAGLIASIFIDPVRIPHTPWRVYAGSGACSLADRSDSAGSKFIQPDLMEADQNGRTTNARDQVPASQADDYSSSVQGDLRQ